MVYLLVLVAVLTALLAAAIMRLRNVKENLEKELRWRNHMENQYTFLVSGIKAEAPNLVLEDLLKEGEILQIKRRKIED
jgi:hypothetical protein